MSFTTISAISDIRYLQISYFGGFTIYLFIYCSTDNSNRSGSGW